MDLYYSQWATLSTASETSQPHTRSESVVRPMKRARQKHACSTHKAYTVRSPRPLYLCPRKPSHQVLIPGPPRQNLRVSPKPIAFSASHGLSRRTKHTNNLYLLPWKEMRHFSLQISLHFHQLIPLSVRRQRPAQHTRLSASYKT